MSEANMKCYYCHECGKNFSVSERNDPACDGCGSEFVELVNAEESHSVGSLAARNMPPDDPPFSIATTSIGRDTASSAGASSTTNSARPRPTTTTTTGNATGTTTTTTTTTGSSRTPINITIGSNPIFRRGGHGLFNAFAAGNGSLDGRQSPMDTEQDPGDEVLSAAQLRRRTTSQVRGGAMDPSVGMFPGGMFMVSQSSRGGPSRQSLGQMIHQHIHNVLAQRDEEEETDEGRQQGEAQPQQQQPQPPQQPQRGAQPPPSAAAGQGSGAPRGNVRVINFPSVQVMMSQGPLGGQQQQAAGGGVGQQQQQQQQPGTSQAGSAGSANPQLPQFGMPMFFGLPQLGPLMGLHGSPSDYAWGAQGLENIISQMLANLEDDGPPPTKKEKLDSLPIVQATQEDLVECKWGNWGVVQRMHDVICQITHPLDVLQNTMEVQVFFFGRGSLCSVCKDDFSLKESLLKLPCSHLYHKDCILPWLEMHDTCPTCRFHINTGKYDEERTA